MKSWCRALYRVLYMARRDFFLMKESYEENSDKINMSCFGVMKVLMEIKCVNRCTGCMHKSLATLVCLYNLVKQRLSGATVVWVRRRLGDTAWEWGSVLVKSLDSQKYFRLYLDWLGYFSPNRKKHFPCSLTNILRLSDTKHVTKFLNFFWCLAYSMID